MSKELVLWGQKWRLPDARTFYQSQFSTIKGNKINQSALCCFHEEKTPSLSLNLETGQFKCHSCGASGGDVMDFYIKKHGITKPSVQIMRDLGAVSLGRVDGQKRPPINSQINQSHLDEVNRAIADALDDEDDDLETTPQNEVGGQPLKSDCPYVENQRLILNRGGVDYPVIFLSLQAKDVALVQLIGDEAEPPQPPSTAFLNELSIDQRAKYARILQLSQALPWSNTDFAKDFKALLDTKPLWLKANDGSYLHEWDLSYMTQPLQGYKEDCEVRQVRWDKYGQAKSIRMIKYQAGAFSFAGKDASGNEANDRDTDAVIGAYPSLPPVGQIKHLIWVEGYRKADIANMVLAPCLGGNTHFVATPSATTLIPSSFVGCDLFHNHAWLDNDTASEQWLAKLCQNLVIDSVFENKEGAEGWDVVDLLGEMPDDFVSYEAWMRKHNRRLSLTESATKKENSQSTAPQADNEPLPWCDLESAKKPSDVLLPPSPPLDISVYHPIIQKVAKAIQADIPLPSVMVIERMMATFAIHACHLYELNTSLRFKVSMNDYWLNLAMSSMFKTWLRDQVQSYLMTVMQKELTHLTKQEAYVLAENEKQAKFIKQLIEDAEKADLAVRSLDNDLDVMRAKLINRIALDAGETKESIKSQMVDVEKQKAEKSAEHKQKNDKLLLAQQKFYLKPKNRIAIADMSFGTLQAVDTHLNTVNATTMIENDEMNSFWGGHSFKNDLQQESVGTLCSRWQYGWAKARPRQDKELTSAKTNACVVIMLAGQPSSLAGTMARIQNFVSSGLFGRFNYSVNPSLDGWAGNKQIWEIKPTGLEDHIHEYHRVLMCAWNTMDNDYESDVIWACMKKDFYSREFAWAPDGGVKSYCLLSLWTDLDLRAEFIETTNTYLRSMNFFGANKAELNGKVVDKCARTLLRTATFRHTAQWVSDNRMTYIRECVDWWVSLAKEVSSLTAEIFAELYDESVLQAMAKVGNHKMHLVYLPLMHFTKEDLKCAFVETDFYAKERVRVAHNVMGQDPSKSARFLIAVVQAHLDGKELAVQAHKKRNGRDYVIVPNCIRVSTIKERGKAGFNEYGEDLLNLISLNPSFVNNDPLLSDLIRFKVVNDAGQRGFSVYEIHPDIDQAWLDDFVKEVKLKLGI